MLPYYWIDLETTGLDPYHDDILEIAIARSEPGNPFQARLLHHQVFYFAGHRWHTEHIDPYVVEMHQNNGLAAECNNQRLLEPFDGVLLALTSIKESGYLAGSSVHFDFEFLRHLCPLSLLARDLHHRHFDVSAIKLLAEALGMPKFPKSEAHRCIADIEESILHLRKCAEWLHGVKFDPFAPALIRGHQ